MARGESVPLPLNQGTRLSTKKVLVVHPYDETTKELEVIYEGKDVDVLHRKDLDSIDVRRMLQIGNYDRIILLGHGSEDGLFNKKNNLYVFTRELYRDYIEHKDIEVIAIWCHANEFFIKEGEPENVFATGMFISEVGEAGAYFINESEQVIKKQFKLFSDVMSVAAYLPMNEIRDYVSKNYIGKDKVTKFNRESMMMD